MPERTDVLAPPIERFQVIVNYCSGYQIHHDHMEIEFASKEYTTLLGIAIEDEDADPAEVPRHLRQVHLLVFTPEGTLRSHLDSGIFGCQHRR